MTGIAWVVNLGKLEAYVDQVLAARQTTSIDPSMLLSVIFPSVPKFPGFCTWTVPYNQYHTPYRLYHTQLHQNVHPLTILDIPVRQLVTSCLYAPQYIRYTTNFQLGTCPDVFYRYDGTTVRHASYTLVGFRFFESTCPNGAQSDFSNAGIAKSQDSDIMGGKIATRGEIGDIHTTYNTH